MASINAVLTAENGDDLYPETYDDYVLDSNGEALSTRLGSRSEASGVSGTSAFEKINTLSSDLAPLLTATNAAISPYNNDLNNCKKAGLFATGTSAANNPTAGFYVVLVLIRDAANLVQIAFEVNTGATYSRTLHDNTLWNAWKRLDNT